MSDIAIRVENLSKQYRLGQRERYKSLRDVLVQSAVSPFQRLRSAFQPGSYGIGSETIWALKDVSFEVQQGEVVGIIGRNGAGKSTLLKILSRITKPTRGFAEIHGRVGSLLEVGTGFHPELTGRENIYLNGAILGMKRAEIDRKFDEIVDFSEIEKFLDTPVKRYSSGMYMRLAFSVAAHLEPEILLVDEVLAVGDAEFQKKCLGKMGEVASEGRTVLFVSHNMGAITRLCQRAIWLETGKITKQGESVDTVNSYLAEKMFDPDPVLLPSDSKKPMRLREVKIIDKDGVSTNQIEISMPFDILVKYDINQTVRAAHVICFINTIDGIRVLGTGDADVSPKRLGSRLPGQYIGKFSIPAFLLGEGQYSLTLSLGVPFHEVYDRHENIFGFEIIDHTSKRREWQHQRRPGILGLEIPWTYDNEPSSTE